MEEKNYKKNGLIIKGIGGFYYVLLAENNIVIECKAKGIFKNLGITPTVGDYVDISREENDHNVITKIYDRKNIFIRPPVANVDSIIIVVTENEPKVSLEILDKFLIMAEKNNIKPIICVNKKDLIKGESIIEEIYKDIYTVVKISAEKDRDLLELKTLIPKGKTVLAGPSGVGKSTILNKLLNRTDIETGQISNKTKRGKHTTRHVEIFQYERDKHIFDTPGFTSFELKDIEQEELQEYYPEIKRAKEECRYANCSHNKEPGCRVKELIEEGLIKRSRYKNYTKLYSGLEKKWKD